MNLNHVSLEVYTTIIYCDCHLVSQTRTSITNFIFAEIGYSGVFTCMSSQWDAESRQALGLSCDSSTWNHYYHPPTSSSLLSSTKWKLNEYPLTVSKITQFSMNYLLKRSWQLNDFTLKYSFVIFNEYLLMFQAKYSLKWNISLKVHDFSMNVYWFIPTLNFTESLSSIHWGKTKAVYYLNLTNIVQKIK